MLFKVETAMTFTARGLNGRSGLAANKLGSFSLLLQISPDFGDVSLFMPLKRGRTEIYFRITRFT